jgi:hypothetical protein
MSFLNAFILPIITEFSVTIRFSWLLVTNVLIITSATRHVNELQERCYTMRRWECFYFLSFQFNLLQHTVRKVNSLLSSHLSFLTYEFNDHDNMRGYAQFHLMLQSSVPLLYGYILETLLN